VRSYFVNYRFVVQRYDDFLTFTPTFWELLLCFGEQTAVLFMQMWQKTWNDKEVLPAAQVRYTIAAR
jgi:hypothetical protein